MRSFRDADKRVIDYCQTIIESEEVRSALGRLVPTVEAARLTPLSSIAIQAAQCMPDFCRVVVALIDPEVPAGAAPT